MTARPAEVERGLSVSVLVCLLVPVLLLCAGLAVDGAGQAAANRRAEAVAAQAARAGMDAAAPLSLAGRDGGPHLALEGEGLPAAGGEPRPQRAHRGGARQRGARRRRAGERDWELGDHGTAQQQARAGAWGCLRCPHPQHVVRPAACCRLFPGKRPLFGTSLIATAALRALRPRVTTLLQTALNVLLVGAVLVLDGLDVHVAKAYIYFAMGFSVLVEVLNLLMRRAASRHHVPGAGEW